MKFCCINDAGWVTDDLKNPTTGPSKRDIVTKISEYGKQGVLYIRLKEWPLGDGSADNGYQADCFIPINEQKEESKMKQVTFEEIKKRSPNIR